ncbi:MaoC-like dehydratase domain-containing protein (plasmid) [Rhizobium gallicum]|uniref:MaoC-like dehydratase domain-containing protein n=1 Tax=Rhizobium gallicum TaxID=56730 RepID=A0A1L5NS16_9HYPH|nr:MaoC/PaaZ C-terminal domain-containing protein [Rhizobium gallicum]APO70691.1 MaoC-like dehydratase domain-containing protein [Rhizobium gallicum]
MTSYPASGDKLPEEMRAEVQRHHLVEWCAAENDFYPLHYDDRFARSIGLDTPLIQGTYKLGLLGQYVVHVFGPTAILRSIGIRYTRPTAERNSLVLGGIVLNGRQLTHGIELDLDLWIGTEPGRAAANAVGQATLFLPK